MQHESGTIRSSFDRIKWLMLVTLSQTLSRHSSNRIAPQHLNCKIEFICYFSVLSFIIDDNDLPFVASSRWQSFAFRRHHSCLRKSHLGFLAVRCRFVFHKHKQIHPLKIAMQTRWSIEMNTANEKNRFSMK